MKVKPIVMHIRGFEILLWSLIIADNFKKVEDGEDSRRDYCIYVGRYKKTGVIYYIGKGIYIDGKGHLCRIIMHRHDLLASTINPDEWIGEIWFNGLSETQAYAAEAYLISICDRPRSRKGQRIGDIDSLINKKKETKHEELIEENLKLDGNNNGEALIREINRN